MDAGGWALTLLGGAIALAALMDALLTILHPDIEGPIARRVQHLVWWPVLPLIRLRPRLRRGLLSAVGPAMMVSTIAVWLGLFYLGFAVLYAPHLSTGFRLPAELGTGLGFLDALYYSAGTGSVLGFGDITPVVPAMQLASVAEAVLGFALMGALVTYIFSVLGGVAGRDMLALRIHAETAGTGDGVRLVAESLAKESTEALRTRLADWAEAFEGVQERLHRFPVLTFYYRSRDPVHDPEPLMAAILDVALAARIAAGAPETRALELSAVRLDLIVHHFMRVVARQYMGDDFASRLSEPRPEPRDVDRVREVRARLEEAASFTIEAGDAAAERELRALAFRSRIFLEELDRLTGWGQGEKWQRTWSAIDPPGAAGKDAESPD